MRFLLSFLFSILLGAQASLEFSTLALQADQARDAGRYADAASLYRRALTMRPNWAEGQWSLATVQYELQQYVPCRDQLRRLFAKNSPGSLPVAVLGLCEFGTKEYPLALRHLTMARQMGLPETSDLTKAAVLTEALLWNKNGGFEQAMALYPLLMKLNPDSPRLVIGAGLTALRQAKFPDEVEPQSRELTIKLGRAILLAADRRAAEAKPLFEEVAAQYPGVNNVHYSFGAFLLGADAPRALAEFEKELTLQPNHVPALVSLTMEYLKSADPAKAKTYADRAVKIAPTNFAARASLGRVLNDLEDVPGAIRELEMAAKLAPDSPQVRFSLGAAYAKAGRTKEAAREREIFQKLKQQTSPTDIK
jgi:tetratricopeptide (TPR) repeat protein